MSLDKVVITTPYSYISSNINRPIQIWVDVGSNLWNMKIEKDISNLVVLRNHLKKVQYLLMIWKKSIRNITYII